MLLYRLNCEHYLTYKRAIFGAMFPQGYRTAVDAGNVLLSKYTLLINNTVQLRENVMYQLFNQQQLWVRISGSVTTILNICFPLCTLLTTGPSIQTNCTMLHAIRKIQICNKQSSN